MTWRSDTQVRRFGLERRSENWCLWVPGGSSSVMFALLGRGLVIEHYVGHENGPTSEILAPSFTFFAAWWKHLQCFKGIPGDPKCAFSAGARVLPDVAAVHPK